MVVRVTDKESRAKAKNITDVTFELNKYGKDAGTKENVFRGYIAEAAVSEAFNLPWTSKPETEKSVDNGALVNQRDCGPVNVRSMSEMWHHCCVAPHDDDSTPIVFVVCGDHKTCNLVGWCFGEEAKHLPLRSLAGGPARHWFTLKQGKEFLRPISELKDWLKLRGEK